MNDLVAVRSVESRWGSLEELAHELVVNHPEALDAGIDGVVGVTGLDRGVVAWLLRSSREFQVLLDGLVVGEVWGARDRLEAYRNLAGRVRDPSEKLNDVVRGMEYLDAKVGVAGSDTSRQAPQVAIQIVQEGDGSWESDYEGLSFGGRGTQSGKVESEVVDVEFE